MAIQRPRPRQDAPFVTRRSTLGFSAVCVAASFIFQALSDSTSGGPSVLLALSGGVAVVAGIVAWVEGVVLAVRAGSMLWTVVAALPIPPLNAVMCAMFCPAAPAERRR